MIISDVWRIKVVLTLQTGCLLFVDERLVTIIYMDLTCGFNFFLHFTGFAIFLDFFFLF